MSKMFTDLAILFRNNVPLMRHALNGPTMGTRYSAVFFAPEGADIAAIGAALFEAVDRVDRQMSTWKPDSDLNRLNAAPVGDWIAIPRELTTVLAASLRIGRASNGAFDIGVGNLVTAWGFGAAGPKPDADKIAALAGQARPATTTALELDEDYGKGAIHGFLDVFVAPI
jgi:thiamine biosynthesis lipoprotein